MPFTTTIYCSEMEYEMGLSYVLCSSRMCMIWMDVCHVMFLYVCVDGCMDGCMSCHVMFLCVCVDGCMHVPPSFYEG